MTTSNAVNVGTVVNGIVYASGAGVLSQIATGNDGLLVTSNVGVPSILAGPGTTGNVLQANAGAAPSFSTATYPSVATGTGTMLRADGTNWTPTTATYPNTTTINRILFSSANNVISEISTANSGVLVTNGTGVPSVQVGQIPGTATNDSASTGNIGEIISSTQSTPQSMSNGISINVTSILLTPGSWIVYGLVAFSPSGSSLITYFLGINSTSATLPSNQFQTAANYTGQGLSAPAMPTVYKLTVNTTIYLVADVGFGSGTMTSTGTIMGVRFR